MIITVIIAAATAAAMTASIIIKPYVKIRACKVGLYWVVCLVGAALMLLFGQISFDEVFSGITADTSVNPLKILTLFLSMTIISIYLGESGFFDYIAERVFSHTKKGGLKLFFALYFVVAVLTVFTSNDIIILTFTPPVCIFCKKAGLSPIPYLFGEFVAANTWSMALIIGNPTNIYLASAFGADFFTYLSVMWLPALSCGAVSLAVLLLLFYKPLSSPPNLGEEISFTPQHIVRLRKTPMAEALIALILCIILLAVSNFIGIEMWLICLIIAVLLTLADFIYETVFNKKPTAIFKVLKKAPYELIPFILSMFVIVLSLDRAHFTEAVKNVLLTGAKSDGISFAFISAFSANFLNNIPMSVLFEKFAGNAAALYGSVIGSNVGAFITPVGALAGIMWSKILGEYGVKFSFKQFCFYGLTVAIPSIAVASATLLLTL